MSIVKTDVPMTPTLCVQTIEKITALYPFTRSEILTTTAYGRSLRTLVIGRGGRKVIFTAAHHANEWITATLLLKFAEDLAQAIALGGSLYGIPARLFDANATIYLVPMVDPDGVALVTGELPPDSPGFRQAAAIAAQYPAIPFPSGWKSNLLGVDLNLQYPAGWMTARQIKFAQGYTGPAPRDYVGRTPLNQREAIALYGYTEFLAPALVLAFHSQGREIYWQFRDIFVEGARELGEEFARLSGYRLSQPENSSSYAGYKDWFIQRYRRPGFTIEVGVGENPLPLSQFDTIYRENLGILTTAALGLPESPGIENSASFVP